MRSLVARSTLTLALPALLAGCPGPAAPAPGPTAPPPATTDVAPAASAAAPVEDLARVRAFFAALGPERTTHHAGVIDPDAPSLLAFWTEGG